MSHGECVCPAGVCVHGPNSTICRKRGYYYEPCYPPDDAAASSTGCHEPTTAAVVPYKLFREVIEDLTL